MSDDLDDEQSPPPRGARGAPCPQPGGPRPATSHQWAIVLAGGSGTRLRALTQTGQGACTPKQYCSIDGQRSLLRMAIDRAERVVPREQVVVVVARDHEPHWRQESRTAAGPVFLVQPENRGTAPGLLLPLLAVAHRDPGAVVCLLAADHFVTREDVLAGAMQRAQARAAATDAIVLLGIEPDAPEPEYGWILPTTRTGPWRQVAAFVEKPSAPEAARLFADGAVWNALLLAAPAERLLAMYASRTPELLARFRQARPHLDADSAANVYRDLPSSDFSRDLLQGSEAQLSLHVAPACGWTDLGTPERVRQCLVSMGGARRPMAGSMLDLAARSRTMWA